jgi:hypothetical protein
MPMVPCHPHQARRAGFEPAGGARQAKIGRMPMFRV